MKNLPIALAVLAACSTTNAQTTPQQNAAKRVFTRFRALNEAKKLNTPSAKALVADEAKQYTQSEQLGPFSKPDAFVFPDATHAVARVQGLDEKGHATQDVYFYLNLVKGSWKVAALRSLALTGMIEQAQQELENKPHLTAKDQEELANIHLTLALDADLRRHFANHRAAFARLSTSQAHPLSKAEEAQLRHELYFNPVPHQSGDGLQWVIGGMTDNTVGFGFSPSGKLPAIERNEVIWVERLSKQWYLFRTT